MCVISEENWTVDLCNWDETGFLWERDWIFNFRTEFLILGTEFLILGTEFLILGTEFLILSFEVICKVFI
jgi:hypothetical protein